MPIYRVQFTEVISYDVTFNTDTPIPLDKHGYPETEDDWFSRMEEYTSTWHLDNVVKIGERELDGPIEVLGVDG